jgi:flagellar hook-length control protein FliK
LTAQLGLPVSPESLASTTDSEQPAFEQKSDAQVAADPQVSSDPAAALPFVPFDLPVTSAKITVEDAGQGDQPHNPITAFLPGRVELPVLPKAPRPLVEEAEALPGAEPSEEASTPQPATFAALLQSLPPPEAAAKQEHPAIATDDSPPSPQVPILLTTDTKSDTAHRPSVLTTSVPVPVQDSRWGERFSERVVWLTGRQVQAAEIHVEPAHLGPIEVRISVVNDQANLLFTAPHAVARDAIQLSLPRLQDMLVDSGLTLGSVAVGAHTTGQEQSPDRDGAAHANAQASERGMELESRQSITALRRATGLVDLFA